MKLFTCINKHRNESGVIRGYTLVGVTGGMDAIEVGADELKSRMRSGEIDVMNLTLTSDNKLVDAGQSKNV